MVVHTKIQTAVPGISSSALQQAVAFAVDVMRQTRDAYHEPVALQEVAIGNAHSLHFIVRTLFTHNTSDFELNFAPGNMYQVTQNV